MKNKENIIKTIIVVATIIICVAACLITFFIVSGQVKASQESNSKLSEATSKYDYSAMPDSKYAGTYKIASATVTDKFGKKYDVDTNKFALTLNFDGSATCVYSPFNLSSRAIQQIEADNQKRIDALSDSEKNELNKETEAYIKEIDQGKGSNSDSQLGHSYGDEERVAKYKMIYMVNSDASIGDISSFGINHGEWRNTESNLLVAGENSFQEFSIETDGTLFCKIGNVDVILKKA